MGASTVKANIEIFLVCRSGMPELAWGGAFYLFGVLIFKCDGIIPFAHAIWHLLVACGAFTHYYGICNHLYAWH